MKNKWRWLWLVSWIGFMLSIGGAVHASNRYLALSQSAKEVELMYPDDDVMARKIEALLGEDKNKSLILGTLHNRHELNVSMHATLREMTAEAKRRAMNELFLWMGYAVISYVFMSHSATCFSERRLG
jgi:hypothetical protein